MPSAFLFATDGSNYAETSLRQMVDCARRLKKRLDVAHVVDPRQAFAPLIPPTSGGLFAELQAPASRRDSLRVLLVEEGQKVLDSARIILREANVEGDAFLLEGPITSSLIEKAKEYELLGMGKKGLSHGWSDADVGSTLERVLRRVSRPVLVGSGRPRPIERVLFAYDASPSAERMKPLVLDICESLGAGITFLGVAESPAQREECANRLEKACREAMLKKIAAAIKIETGYPEEEILQAAAQGDFTLIAMGMYGHHRLVELFLGSAARVVLRRSEAAVLLLR